MHPARARLYRRRQAGGVAAFFVLLMSLLLLLSLDSANASGEGGGGEEEPKATTSQYGSTEGSLVSQDTNAAMPEADPFALITAAARDPRYDLEVVQRVRSATTTFSLRDFQSGAIVQEVTVPTSEVEPTQ